MRAATWVIVVVTILVPLHAAAATAFAALQDSSTVAVVDAATGAVKPVTVPIYPHNVERCGHAILAVGTDASMQGDLSHMPMVGKLVEIDPATLTVTRVTPVGMHPAHVVCDFGAQRAFVTLSEENAVAVVDLASFRVVRNIDVGAFPHGMRLSADGHRLFVANQQSQSVSVVDVDKGKEVAQIPVPGNPVQVAVDPNARYVYATLGRQNAVVAIDVADRRIAQRVEVGRNPAQLTISRDGRVLVIANQGSTAHPDNRLSIVELPRLTAVRWVQVGSGPHGVAIDPNGKRAYVTCAFAGTLAIVDLPTGATIASYRVGTDPNGVAFLP